MERDGQGLRENLNESPQPWAALEGAEKANRARKDLESSLILRRRYEHIKAEIDHAGVTC